MSEHRSGIKEAVAGFMHQPGTRLLLLFAMEGLLLQYVTSINGFGNNLYATNLGAKDGATGLPVATWSLKNYSVEEYEQQLADVIAGKIEIDNTVVKEGEIADIAFSNVTLNYV